MSHAIQVLKTDMYHADPSDIIEIGDGKRLSQSCEETTILNASFCLPASATVHPARDLIENSKAKEILRTTWHGLQYLFKSVEGCLDGTPFKTPIAAINVVIELGNVCPSLVVDASSADKYHRLS